MDNTTQLEHPDPSSSPVEPVAEQQHGRTKKQKKPQDPDAPRPLRIHMIVRGVQVKLLHPHISLVSSMPFMDTLPPGATFQGAHAFAMHAGHQ